MYRECAESDIKLPIMIKHTVCSFTCCTKVAEQVRCFTARSACIDLNGKSLSKVLHVDYTYCFNRNTVNATQHNYIRKSLSLSMLSKNSCAAALFSSFLERFVR